MYVAGARSSGFDGVSCEILRTQHVDLVHIFDHGISLEVSHTTIKPDDSLECVRTHIWDLGITWVL